MAVADVVEAMRRTGAVPAGARHRGRPLPRCVPGAGRLYDPDAVAACERLFAEGFAFDD